MTIQKTELIIPVYLNQRIVFDLVAMLQDGISTVTRVYSSEHNIESNEKRYGAAFGLSQALASLMKIGVSTDKAKKSEDESEIKKSEERVHTPSSLFQKLRKILKEENKIIIPDSEYKPKSGDIVEFSTTLRRNPIIQTMNTFISMMKMAIDMETPPKDQKHGSLQLKETKRIKSQMENFLGGLKTGDTIDIISETLLCNYKSVITLEVEYLNDPFMSDLVDGQFNVLGKTIRVIEKSNESINLLRKTALSSMGKDFLNKMFTDLSKSVTDVGIEIPDIELEIKGPVIQVIPIAIFS